MTTTEDTTAPADEAPAPAEGNGADITDDHDDPRDRGTIEVMPPAREISLAALGTLRDHVASMREAKFFADLICESKLVPQRFQNQPADGAAAILFGAELELSPMASLRSVIVVNGSPGLEARTMKGLLKSKGYAFRTITATNDEHEIWAWEPDSPRIFDDKGLRVSPDEVGHITMDDCIQEGWVPRPRTDDSLRRPNVKEDWDGEERSGRNGKYWVVFGNMKYITSPKVMLRAKATAEVCRTIAPHILLGLPYSTDDLADMGDSSIIDAVGDYYDPPQQRRQASRARGMDGLRDRARQATTSERADVQDADEVPLPDEEDGPGAPDQQPAETSPTPPKADDTPAADEAQAEPLADDQPKQKSQRQIAMDHMFVLFGEGKMTDREERLMVISEIIAKRPGAEYRRIESSNDLKAIELRYLVDTLQDWKKKGKLVDWLVEGLNAASIREAGLNDD